MQVQGGKAMKVEGGGRRALAWEEGEHAVTVGLRASSLGSDDSLP